MKLENKDITRSNEWHNDSGEPVKTTEHHAWSDCIFITIDNGHTETNKFNS